MQGHRTRYDDADVSVGQGRVDAGHDRVRPSRGGGADIESFASAEHERDARAPYRDDVERTSEMRRRALIEAEEDVRRAMEVRGTFWMSFLPALRAVEHTPPHLPPCIMNPHSHSPVVERILFPHVSRPRRGPGRPTRTPKPAWPNRKGS